MTVSVEIAVAWDSVARGLVTAVLISSYADLDKALTLSRLYFHVRYLLQ